MLFGKAKNPNLKIDEENKSDKKSYNDLTAAKLVDKDDGEGLSDQGDDRDRK